MPPVEGYDECPAPALRLARLLYPRMDGIVDLAAGNIGSPFPSRDAADPPLFLLSTVEVVGNFVAAAKTGVLVVLVVSILVECRWWVKTLFARFVLCEESEFCRDLFEAPGDSPVL